MTIRLFRDAQGEPRIRSHWHNDSADRKPGAWPRSARWWLHWPGNCLHIEYNLFARRCALSVDLKDDEDDLVIHIAIPLLIQLFVCLGHCKPLLKILGLTWQQVKNKDTWYYRREIGFSVHDGGLWLYPWINPHEGGRGRRNAICIDPKNILLGRAQYSSRNIKEIETEIIMPEGRYPATVELFVSEWRRPRWPWAERLMRADIEIPGGIPIPGKGENSWDCDDDAIFSMVCPAATVAEAKQAVYQSAMRDRLRRAAADWVPDEGWPTHCWRRAE